MISILMNCKSIYLLNERKSEKILSKSSIFGQNESAYRLELFWPTISELEFLN